MTAEQKSFYYDITHNPDRMPNKAFLPETGKIVSYHHVMPGGFPSRTRQTENITYVGSSSAPVVVARDGKYRDLDEVLKEVSENDKRAFRKAMKQARISYFLMEQQRSRFDAIDAAQRTGGKVFVRVRRDSGCSCSR